MKKEHKLKLPPEIWNEIFSFLGMKDILSITETSGTFNSIVNGNKKLQELQTNFFIKKIKKQHREILFDGIVKHPFSSSANNNNVSSTETIKILRSIPKEERKTIEKFLKKYEKNTNKTINREDSFFWLWVIAILLVVGGSFGLTMSNILKSKFDLSLGASIGVSLGLAVSILIIFLFIHVCIANSMNFIKEDNKQLLEDHSSFFKPNNYGTINNEETKNLMDNEDNEEKVVREDDDEEEFVKEDDNEVTLQII